MTAGSSREWQWRQAAAAGGGGGGGGRMGTHPNGGPRAPAEHRTLTVSGRKVPQWRSARPPALGGSLAVWPQVNEFWERR